MSNQLTKAQFSEVRRNAALRWVKRGTENHNWKGDKVQYRQLHSWVSQQLGKPNYCSHCQRKDAKRYDWANISRKYKRDLTDWVRLCRACHITFDKDPLYSSQSNSGYRGVSWFKPTKQWRSYINIEGSRIELGYYKDKEDAANIYQNAALQLKEQRKTVIERRPHGQTSNKPG